MSNIMKFFSCGSRKIFGNRNRKQKEEEEIALAAAAKASIIADEKRAAEIVANEKKLKNDNYMKTLCEVNQRKMTEDSERTICISSDGEDSIRISRSEHTSQKSDRINEDFIPTPRGNARVIDLDISDDEGEEKSSECIAKYREFCDAISMRAVTTPGCPMDRVMWSEASIKPATAGEKLRDTEIPHAFEVKVFEDNYVAIMDEVAEATPVRDKGTRVLSCKERKPQVEVSEFLRSMTDVLAEQKAERSGTEWGDNEQIYQRYASANLGRMITVNPMSADMRRPEILVDGKTTRIYQQKKFLSHEEKARNLEKKLASTIIQLKNAEANENRIEAENDGQETFRKSFLERIISIKNDEEKREEEEKRHTTERDEDSEKEHEENSKGGNLAKEVTLVEVKIAAEEKILSQTVQIVEEKRPARNARVAREERILVVESVNEDRIQAIEDEKPKDNDERVLEAERVLEDEEEKEEEKGSVEGRDQRPVDMENAILAAIEKERLIKLQIFTDLGLHQTSKLTPLKRMKLAIDDRKYSRYETRLMEEKERKTLEEEQWRLKSQEAKMKYDELRKTPSVLHIILAESDRKIQNKYETSLQEEKAVRGWDEYERKIVQDEVRAKRVEIDCAKREESARKTLELVNQNRRTSDEWKKRDMLNVEKERTDRAEGAVRVQSTIQRSLSVEISRRNMYVIVQQLANEKEKRIDSESVRRNSLNNERKALEADSRRARGDMEADTHRASMLIRSEEYERRIACDDERVLQVRQSVVIAEDFARKIREEIYRENERKLKAEYALRTQLLNEQYLGQDSERKSRVEALRRRNSYQDYRSSRECSRTKIELNERAAKYESERKVKQEIALSLFLEEERRITAESTVRADEEAEKRAAMEKKRLSFIETERKNEEKFSKKIITHNDKKNLYETDRKARDENANRLRSDYEKNIRDDLETKRIEKAERKLREENERKVVIEYERRMRDDAPGSIAGTPKMSW